MDARHSLLLLLSLSLAGACSSSHGSPDGAAPDAGGDRDADVRPDADPPPDAVVDAPIPTTCTGEHLGGAGEGCFCQGPFALGPGGIAYRSGAGLDVIDVSGDVPVQIGSVPQMHIGSEGAVTISGDTLFVGSWGIDIYDISTPTEPRPIADVDLEGTVTDLFVRRATLWIGYEGFDETASLRAYDVSDPTLPRLFAEVPLEGSPGSVMPWGDDRIVVLEARRFGDDRSDVATIVDVSSPSSAVITSSVPVEGEGILRRRGAIDGDTLHVVGTAPLLQTIDLVEGRVIARLDAPEGTSGVGLGIHLSDGLAFVGGGGVQVADLSPRGAPRWIGAIESFGDPFYLERDGDRLLVSNGNQLQIVSLDCR